MAIGGLLFALEYGLVYLKRQSGGLVNRWFGVSSTSTGSNMQGAIRGLKPNGAARDCGSRFRGFDSLLSLQVLLGTVIEQHSCNAGGEISIFSRSTSPGFVARMGEGVTLKTS